MTPPIVSISGLRGLVGDGLDPSYVTDFAMALGTMVEGGAVVVTRDGRPSGPMLEHAVRAGLLSTGCRVIDGGIASTPTCGVLVQHLEAAAGFQITASHNPIEWNGLKPFSAEGSIFDEEAGRRLLDILNSRSFRTVGWDALGTVETFDDAAAVHLDRVLKLVDVDAIQKRRFKVLLDCNHGAGGVLGPRLLEALGCQVEVLGSTPDGFFEHDPEPLEKNTAELASAVAAIGADAGFAQDPDADRLAIVDDTGRYIGEELTLALCVDQVLSLTPGPVVVNGSTSRTTADVAARYDCPFHRSHVGEAHVVAKMKEVSAILGGEGNGGVIEPQVGYVRDSFVAMAYVLAGLAAGDQTLAQWTDSLPSYTIVKDKLTCPREKIDAACAALETAFADATPQMGDGLRLDWNDRWVQVRASNTEPILRIIAEAPESAAANDLCAEAVNIVREAVGEAG